MGCGAAGALAQVLQGLVQTGLRGVTGGAPFRALPGRTAELRAVAEEQPLRAHHGSGLRPAASVLCGHSSCRDYMLWSEVTWDPTHWPDPGTEPPLHKGPGCGRI